MAAQAIRARFALDSNVLIDLGEGKSFAKAFVLKFQSQGLAVPPTVVQELAYIATTNHPACRFALQALSKMRNWNILPYDLKSVGHGITEADARKLMDRHLLPEEEFNDGLVLIETALAGIPTLVTSDNHLLRINPAQLTNALADFDLPPVAVYHPRDLLR